MLPAANVPKSDENPQDLWAVVWRAADYDAKCKFVLQNHGKTKPQHIMDNVRDRFPAEVIEELKTLLRSKVQHYDDMCKKSVHSDRHLLWQSIGREYLKQALEKLVGSIGREGTTGWCSCCNMQCHCHPPRSERLGRLYIHIAGTPCQAWSSMGKQGGWLHDTSLTFACWLACALSGAPDVIIHENTPRFDWQAFQILAPEYTTFSESFSPSHIGLPVVRNRRYSILVRSSLKMIMPWELSTLIPTIGRRVIGSGQMFWRAPESYINKILGQRTLKRKHSGDGDEMFEDEFECIDQGACNAKKIKESLVAASHVLPSSEALRLREHVRHAVVEKLAFVVVNVRADLSDPEET